MGNGIKAVGAAAVLAAALAACAMGPEREALVAGELPCMPMRFDVYFLENQARLTPAAEAAIEAAAGQVRQCAVSRVRILGLADAVGAPEANLTLSQQRARQAARALAAAGLPAPAFELAAAGDAGAVTASGTEEPLRRRTEVVIEARPR